MIEMKGDAENTALYILFLLFSQIVMEAWIGHQKTIFTIYHNYSWNIVSICETLQIHVFMIIIVNICNNNDIITNISDNIMIIHDIITNIHHVITIICDSYHEYSQWYCEISQYFTIISLIFVKNNHIDRFFLQNRRCILSPDLGTRPSSQKMTNPKC